MTYGHGHSAVIVGEGGYNGGNDNKKHNGKNKASSISQD